MTAPVPPVDLDQLAATLAAATPGPWQVDREAIYSPGPMAVAETNARADAAAIVAAVNAAPLLVAELRAIRAERDTLRRQLAVAREVYRRSAPLDGDS